MRTRMLVLTGTHTPVNVFQHQLMPTWANVPTNQKYLTLWAHKCLLIPSVQWYNWVPTLQMRNTICHLMMTQWWSSCKTGLTLIGMQIQGPITASPSPSLSPNLNLVLGLYQFTFSKRKNLGALAGNWLRQDKWVLLFPLWSINRYYLSTYCMNKYYKDTQWGKTPTQRGRDRKAEAASSDMRPNFCLHFHMAQDALKETMGFFPPQLWHPKQMHQAKRAKGHNLTLSTVLQLPNTHTFFILLSL